MGEGGGGVRIVVGFFGVCVWGGDSQYLVHKQFTPKVSGRSVKTTKTI